AKFTHNGVTFQATKNGCGSQAAAMVIARACYVKLAEGADREEVLQFRDASMQQAKEIHSASEVPPAPSGEEGERGEVDGAGPPSKQARTEATGDDATSLS
ncbi:unnamed protein product, partial [Effrenium voratum]